MPKWLIKQLKQAYKAKDRRQRKYLNECWLSFQSSADEAALNTAKTQSK